MKRIKMVMTIFNVKDNEFDIGDVLGDYILVDNHFPINSV